MHCMACSTNDYLQLFTLLKHVRNHFKYYIFLYLGTYKNYTVPATLNILLNTLYNNNNVI